MLKFSPDKIQRLLDLINFRQVLFVAKHVGSNMLTIGEQALLRMRGVAPEALLEDEADLPQAFKFGMLTVAADENQVKKLTLPAFQKFLSSGKFVPLNGRERAALESVQQQALTDIKGLGHRMGQDLQQDLRELTDSHRAPIEAEDVREAATETLKEREDVKEMALRLGHRTGQWARDFDRISDFVMHRALDEGRAAAFATQAHKQGQPDPWVFKDVYAGACKHCIRLYLSNGVGSAPKVFRLSELQANGSNVGRKVADWKPVVGPTHPFCRCTLGQRPPGTEWNEKLKRFAFPVPEKVNLTPLEKPTDTPAETGYKRQVTRRSTVKVTVLGENYEV
jgi:hypothetical protein